MKLSKRALTLLQNFNDALVHLIRTKVSKVLQFSKNAALLPKSKKGLRMRALLRKGIRQRVDCELTILVCRGGRRVKLSESGKRLFRVLGRAMQQKVDFHHKMVKIGMMSLKGKRLMSLWNAAL